MAPGKLGDVDQAVDAVEVDERAEVDDVGDRALDHLAALEPVEDLLAGLLALLLEHRAPRQHDVVAAAVQLDHLALDLLAEELVEVLDAADVDQRGRQEAAHAEVDDQPALDDLDHGALDGLAGLGRGLDAAPGALEAGALLGQDQAAVLVLLGEHQRVDLLAQLDLLGRVDRAPDRQLALRDDALGLVADVDQDLVLVDADDLARHDVALLEGDHRGVVVRDQLAVDFDHEVVQVLQLSGLRAACGGVSTCGTHSTIAALRWAESVPLPSGSERMFGGVRVGAPIQQAYRFALAPTPEQKTFLAACCGASRFWFNQGLALVKDRLGQRAAGHDVDVPWSYKGLCGRSAALPSRTSWRHGAARW